MKALLKQDAYPSKIRAKVKVVTESVDRFRAYAEECHHSATFEIHKAVKEIQGTVLQKCNLLVDANDVAKDNQAILKTSLMTNADTQRTIETLRMQIYEQSQTITAMAQSQLAVKNDMLAFLQDGECKLRTLK